jgi:amino acid transporter
VLSGDPAEYLPRIARRRPPEEARMSQVPTHSDADAERLAELGYSQEFDRRWSGFSNFAISFSIISILSGCFTTFGQAWNNGGPIAISIGWPVISAFILIIGLCMSELVSSFPTAGGIYYWAFRLGKPRDAWLTGWLNLTGLVAVIAGVDYGFAQFFTITMGHYNSWWDVTDLQLVFSVFIVTVLVHVLINVFGARVISKLQNVNVYWHVFGVAAIVLILFLIPDNHQSASFVFTHHNNNSGFSSSMFWWYVLPLGFLLTQYTITGFDASAHVSEETSGAAKSAARGIWQSILYSAIGGWIMLLAFLFAATKTDVVAAGGVPAILDAALSSFWAKTILIIACVGQFFCGMSCVTAASRMLFAFSRDRAVPGHNVWRRLDANRNPSFAAIAVATAAIVLTLPALITVSGHEGTPVAFFAVTSITVIGLYLAFMIPIWLRFKHGDRFPTGPWSLGRHYRWMCPVAVAEIIIISIYFILPTVPSGVPFNDDFEWGSVQYAPIAVVVVVGGAMLWWALSAKRWFTGPVRTIEGEDPLAIPVTSPAP